MNAKISVFLTYVEAIAYCYYIIYMAVPLLLLPSGPVYVTAASQKF